MLKKIQIFFETCLMPRNNEAVGDRHQLNLAAASLLVEMMHQDDDIQQVEIDNIKAHLVGQLMLSSGEADQLFKLAEVEKTSVHRLSSIYTVNCGSLYAGTEG